MRIDGHDLRKVTTRSLREQLAVVPQEAFLFTGSIVDNIRFGRPDASLEEVQRIARIVGVHDFVEGLPEGYDTDVQEGGSALSTGQRQLISFARALLADPRVLILDEATSSVDAESEQRISRAMDVLFSGRTSVIVAHRLSTVRYADEILVIEDGRIVERGDHDGSCSPAAATRASTASGRRPAGPSERGAARRRRRRPVTGRGGARGAGWRRWHAALMSGSVICSAAEATVAPPATANEPATPMTAAIGPATAMPSG